MPPALQLIAFLVIAYGVTHLLCDLFERADRLPLWLTPRLAALFVTFFVAIYWILKAIRPADDINPGFIE